jgi:hypothetical protein
LLSTAKQKIVDAFIAAELPFALHFSAASLIVEHAG